ncbi:hypothetical protein MNBD_ALPHA11-1426 [hydrothermal vent metagenome]|uniref:Uncharacterized protein n=1 Tax=hydrothermal vent metagenome TaxID=652676 RepID=A0A3B0TP15_9ZZZZ
MGYRLLQGRHFVSSVWLNVGLLSLQQFGSNLQQLGESLAIIGDILYLNC